MTNYSNRGGFGSSDWLIGAVKNNPEGLLLMAAGCALLMRGGVGSWGGGSRRMSSGQNMRSGQHMGHYESSSGRQSYTDGDRSKDWGITDGINRSVESARDYASGLGRSVSETASDYASSVGEYADKAKRSIMDSSGRLAEQAQSTLQSTVERVVREQPFAVVMAGLAAGAAVAAAFPPTSIERQTLGPAGERLSDMASRTKEQLQEAASAAGERLMSTAEEHGLSKDGLKEMATEAADAFGNAFSGEKQDKGSSSSTSGSSGTSNMGSRGSQPGQAGSSQGGMGSQSAQAGSRSTSPSRSPSSGQSGGSGGSGRGPGMG